MKINPAIISNEPDYDYERQVLFNFLEQVKLPIYKPEIFYDVYIPQTQETIKVKLEKYSLIARPGKKNRSPRYEVIDLDSKMLGAGSYGRVYDIVGTIILRNGKAHFGAAENSSFYSSNQFFHPHARVDKIQMHDKSQPSTSDHGGRAIFMHWYNNEVTHTKLAKNLRFKHTLQEHNNSMMYTHIIMEKYDADLGKLLDAERSPGLAWSTDTRYALTLALLYALKEIHDRGVMHRDIKYANIVCNMKDPLAPDVAIIDYSFASTQKLDKHICGTPHFLAPEVGLGFGGSKASDTYSLARVIGAVWRADYPREKKYAFPNLFAGIDDLSSHERHYIASLLEQMHTGPLVKNNWDADLRRQARMRLESAIHYFESLWQQRAGYRPYVAKMAEASDTSSIDSDGFDKPTHATPSASDSAGASASESFSSTRMKP